MTYLLHNFYVWLGHLNFLTFDYIKERHTESWYGVREASISIVHFFLRLWFWICILIQLLDLERDYSSCRILYSSFSSEIYTEMLINLASLTNLFRSIQAKSFFAFGRVFIYFLLLFFFFYGLLGLINNLAKSRHG